MKIKLTKDDIPLWTDDKPDPIDLGDGLTLRFTIENDGYLTPSHYLPDLIEGDRPDNLWDEMLETMADDIRNQFYDAMRYGDDLADEDFDFPQVDGAPGMWVIESCHGWRNRYMPDNDNYNDVEDPAERRRCNYQDAKLWRGWLRDDWRYVDLGAIIDFNGAEVGSAYVGGIEWGLPGYKDYFPETFAELADEAWHDVRPSMEKLAERLDIIGGHPVMTEQLEVEREAAC